MEATALHIFFEFWEIIRFCSVQVIKYIIRVHSFLQKNGDVAVGLEQTWQKVGYWRGKTCNTCCIPPKMFSLTDEKNKHSGRFAVTTTCFLKKCHDDKKKKEFLCRHFNHQNCHCLVSADDYLVLSSCFCFTSGS